jgi:transcription elongation GreA/GreB family factor
MIPKIDKQALLSAFKEQLEGELARAKERARDAADAATHVENRAEGDKDMRATEASYVARGHSERVFQLERALQLLAVMQPRQLDEGDPIGQGAVVCLEQQGNRSWYFLIPVGGGERVTVAGVSFQALTAQSPLGAALMGLSTDDEVEVATPQGPRTSLIVSVQ